MVQLTAFPQNMLVIDDEAGLLRALELLLKTLGHKARTVSDSKEAIQILSSPEVNEYTLIVSDLRMPEVDGFQVLEARNKHAANIPFILMSGHATSEEVDRAIAEGANGFLGKPFRPEALEDLLQSL